MGNRRVSAKPEWTWNREYWSRRYGTPISWGVVGKWLTHKRERAERRRVEKKFQSDPKTFDNT